MKFSIVTPSFNMEDWIAETIESVISQEGDFEVEYIIVDNKSKDNTLLIAQKYKDVIDSGNYPIKCKSVEMRIITKDRNGGMYNAINKGFSGATGDVYAWINADDVYEPYALDKIKRILNAFPEIEWVKGITSTIDDNGDLLRRGKCKTYHQDWIAKGVYGQESYFIEQDSVFWRKHLWEKIGLIPPNMRSAGDYWLWLQFAMYAPLWSLNAPISRFRKREGQISKDVTRYKREQNAVRPRRSFSAWRARLFFTPQSRLVSMFPKLEPFFVFIYPIIFWNKFPVEYIEIENNTPIKKGARSYTI